ncbi:MAG: diacylglycerol kinase family protein [Novosphingobium aromaticivorans]|nr:diacylglycerol kinase family protein [Novosphingobium aromaticivorans]
MSSRSQQFDDSPENPVTNPVSGPLWLLLNPASGSNSEDSQDQLLAALAHSGHAPARVLRLPEDPLPTRAMLEEAGVGILAIFTGDGTANAQIEKLHGWPGAVLVLPGGTQNLLSKALHGHADAPAIVRRLGTPGMIRTRRQGVRTSAGNALVEVLAGPGATWADVREGVRGGDLGVIASALGEALHHTTQGAPVVVSDPPLGKREGYRAVRIDAQAGVLDLDGYDADDWADIVAHGVSILIRRDFRQGPHEELGQAPAVTCTSAEPIALMIDGERREGCCEETFTCIDIPLDFLATRSDIAPRADITPCSGPTP